MEKPTCRTDIVQHRVGPDLCIDRFNEGGHFDGCGRSMAQCRDAGVAWNRTLIFDAKFADKKIIWLPAANDPSFLSLTVGGQ